MKRKVKKLVTLILASAMLLQVVACSTSSDSSSSSTTSTSETSTTTDSDVVETEAMDDFVDYSSGYPRFVETQTITIGIPSSEQIVDMDTNLYTVWIEETLNVDLVFDIYSDATAKVNVLLSADSDLPEIFMGMTIADSELLYYGAEGSILPLNDYIEEYGTYTKAMFESNDIIEPLITSADGNIYALPEMNEQSTNEWGHRVWINQTWLDNLELETPTTTEEFYDVMYAFANDDPNGNGVKDEIAYVGSTGGWNQNAVTWVMNAFTYNDGSDYFQVNDGELSFAFMTDEWRNGLSYLNTLCVDGLLSSLSFSQDQPSLQAMVQNPDGTLVGAFPAGNHYAVTSSDESIYSDYVALAPLTGPDGTCYATYTACQPVSKFYITKDAENPLACFILGDFMLCEEASINSRFGFFENGDWEVPDEDQTVCLTMFGYEALIEPIAVWGDVQNSHWRSNGPAYKTYEIMNGSEICTCAIPCTEDNCSHAAGSLMGKAPDEVVVKLIYTEEESDSLTDVETAVQDYVEEMIAGFVTGLYDVNGSDWDNYIDTLYGIGVEEYLELAQTAYDRMQ